MMGAPAIAGTRTVSLSRAGTSLACGSTVTAGETLNVEMSSTVGEFLIEVEGASVGSDGSGFSSGQCSNKRSTSISQVTAPQSGSFVVRAGYASGYGRVSITEDCAYSISAAIADSEEDTEQQPQDQPQDQPQEEPQQPEFDNDVADPEQEQNDNTNKDESPQLDGDDASGSMEQDADSSSAVRVTSTLVGVLASFAVTLKFA
eukprot:CAMPEP_0196738952 /NCGR_PEP_ID=MMETSP1091-20130531/18295_1 /TAXON_ID=302021 /ORGANISM="Rhodomonas sp., Strain CCMP768" /LENGTH=202 /DNA_ID=CAMNT_0042083111 /DNA_START=118 /DNA_END=726 /DNA_ORIENTATION=-